METSGPEGEVVKVMPALTITDAELGRGLDILEAAVTSVLDAVATDVEDSAMEVTTV